ncbi:MAG: hypothetical protein ABJB47_07300 [Actinomycetota bacterium]
MAIRDTMRAAAARYVRDGEVVQSVFIGQTASQYLVGLNRAITFLPARNRYRIIAATTERIIVIDTGAHILGKKSLMMELPRSTRLGPPKGMWHAFTLGSEKIRVHRRFFADIQAADARAVAVPA